MEPITSSQDEETELTTSPRPFFLSLDTPPHTHTYPSWAVSWEAPMPGTYGGEEDKHEAVLSAVTGAVNSL